MVLRLSAPARGRVEDRPSDRPTDRPSLSFKRRATHTRAHESRRERSHSRRLSCSRYIGQPRRLSRFLRAIHLHALLPPAPTYPSPLLFHLSLFLSSSSLFLSRPARPRLFKKRFHYRDRTWPNVATPAMFPAVTSLYLMYVLVSLGHFYHRVPGYAFSRRSLNILRNSSLYLY